MRRLVEQHIWRTNRNLLATGLVCLAIVSAAAAVSRRYYLNYFVGPFPSTLEEIAQVRGASHLARYFVQLEGQLTATGYEHVTRRVSRVTRRETSRTVAAAYLTLKQADRVLLVRAPGGTSGPRIAGFVADPSSIDRQVLEQLRADRPDAAAKLMPVVLDATGFRLPGTIGLLLLGLPLALGLRNLLVFVFRRARPARHPISRKLSDLGDARSLAAEIDNEGDGGDLLRFGDRVILTRSWLLHETPFSLEPFPLERLVWCHKKVTTQKLLVITVGHRYEVSLRDRCGHSLSVRMAENDVDALLEQITARAPWGIAGWSAELEGAWQSRREELVARVDEQRQVQGRIGPGVC